MSQVLQPSEMEEFYGVLYELILPMLAAANCVKCITQDANTTFTTDVENLLCNLDIEHPAGEIVIQAIQSHKQTFGTGTKTLLFMIASLAKAVTYLHKLGIPSEKSLPVIHETFADLSKEMEEISIISQGYLRSSEEVNCQETISKHFLVTENYNSPDLQSVFSVDHGDCEVIYPYHEKEISVFECKESSDQEVISNSTIGKIQELMNASASLSFDPVYLKMSNLQDMSRDADDVAWFFDSISPNPACTAETKYTHTVDHVSQDILALSVKCSDCLLCTENQDCFVHCFKTPGNDNNLTFVEINSSGNKLKGSYNSESEMEIMGSNHNQNEFLKDNGIFTCKDSSDQYNSDFEDCFDKIDNKQQVLEIIKPLPTVNIYDKNFAQSLSAKVPESNSVEQISTLPKGIEKYCFTDIAVNEESKPLPSNSQKKNYTYDSDEFSTCFGDIDICDSSVAPDNGLISAFNSCENSTKHHISKMLTQQRQQNLPEEILCQGNSQNTLKLGDDTYREFTSALKLKSIGHCDVCSSMLRNIESDIEEYSTEIVTYGNRNIASSKNTDTFKVATECDTINKNNKENIEGEMLLDQLLLHKKLQFRSSLADRIMLSSRHFYNSSESNVCLNSVSQENSKVTQCSQNVNDVDSFIPSSTLISHLNNTGLSRETVFENKEFFSVCVQNGPVSKSALSDLIFENHGEIDNLQEKACNLNDVASMNFSGGLTSCNPIEDSCDLSGEAESDCTIMKLHEITNCLQGCYGDMVDAAKQIVQSQMKNKKNDRRINFHLVDCLSLPSLVSSVSVVPGLALPCDTHTLERLNIAGTALRTLLINADLTSDFHHQGYKPTLSKRTFICKPHSGYQGSDEQLWCASAFDIINQLNVELILVKGKVSGILLDMCHKAGVLLLTNISHHTLSVLSHLHRVDILTYITLATETNLCTIHLQPLSTTWMDHLEKTEKNTVKIFAIVSSASDVQTVILHYSSTMSAQILEERLWNCLHSIANSLVDAKVLPGGGNTELSIANRVIYKSESALASQSYMQSVILDAIADIFHDYYQTVRLNILHEMRDPINEIEDVDLNPALASQQQIDSTLPYHIFSSRLNSLPRKTMLESGLEKDKECSMFVSGTECLQSSLRKGVSDYPAATSGSSLSIFTNCAKQSLNAGLTIPEAPDKTILSQSSNLLHSEFSTSNHSFDIHVYDNFQSKISAWMTAVDVVSVLQSLGSLVISGVDDTDITKDMILL